MRGEGVVFSLVLDGQVCLPMRGGVGGEVALPRGFDKLGDLSETEGRRVPAPLCHVVACEVCTLGGLV